uniref:Gastrula specific embryonic protein 1 n=1 Tax=Epinephelus coioides TaxID=94232 RepID=Q7T0L1_EPICO|nr:gastrula specific embryonic protein 1 [Epinephelus coioides]
MLALVAYTEAQEETFEQKFAKLTEQVTQVGQNLGERLKTGFDDIQTSDFATNSKARLNEFFEWMKTKVQDLNN